MPAKSKPSTALKYKGTEGDAGLKLRDSWQPARSVDHKKYSDWKRIYRG